MANLATINDNILADSGIDPINLIVGTGTVNYIPKFTAEGSIGNSIMTESGANILISSNIVLHAGNYNSYAPTLTGGGASGTWGINISGNASYATSAGNADTVDGLHASAFALAGGSNAIGTWPISITGSASSATAASTANLVIGTSGGAIQSWDIRTIAPSNMTAGRLGFGFTSWTNNNGAPYADYLHLRSYTDASGGNDNLVMFLKSGIGMRIYQQTWGSSAPYVTYVDVLDSGNFNTWVPTKTGGGASGTWGISITGNADTLDGYHASDFALASALANYVPTSRTLTINGVTYDLSANRSWTIAAGVTSIIAGTGISVDQAQGDVRVSNTGVLSVNGSTGDITGIATTAQLSGYLPLAGGTMTGSIAMGGNNITNVSQLAHANGRIILSGNLHIDSFNGYAIYLQYYNQGVTTRIYGDIDMNNYNTTNVNIGYANNSFRAPIFYDSNDTTFYVDPNSLSNLYTLRVGNGAEVPGLIGMGAGFLYGMGVSGAYTAVHAHPSANGVALGSYDGGTFTRKFYVNNDGNAYAITGMYAPIFYDSNNTSYYLDPNGTSNLLTVTILNTYVGNAIYFGGGNNYLNWDGARITSNRGIQSEVDMRAPIFYDTDNTAFYGNFAGTSRFNITQINSVVDQNYYRITNPEGGINVNSGPLTGAIKIKLPPAASFINVMMSLTVQIYNYQTGTSRTIRCGGYNYFDGTWYNVFAYQIGDNGTDTLNVRFGVDGTSNCIWIGETSTYWSYPNVFITDIQAGHSQSSFMAYGWNISFVNSFDTVQTNREAYYQINAGNIASQSVSYASSAGNANTLDGYDSTYFASAASLSNYVPTSRTLTINGVTYDLSANRSWTIASGGVNSIIAGTGISVDQPQGDVRISNTGVLSVNGSTGDITGVLTTSNYSSTLDNRYLFGTTNPGTPGNFNLSIGYNGSYSYVQSHSAQPLYLNPVGNSVFIGSYAAVYNSGTWGISITGNAATVGGYAVSGLWKLNEWNGNLYAHTDGRIYGTIFYDANDDAYFLNPNSSSNLYAVVARSYQGNGNIDGTGSASYHPSGFYSTATSWLYGTLYMAGNNMRSIGGIVQNDIMGRPNVQWGAGGSATGAVIIKFPGGTGNYGMVHAVIDIYEYNGNNVSTVIVGGHNWGSQWYSYGANVVGYTNKQVRVGVKDGQYCIIIGDGSSTWSYGQVVLRKIQNGAYYSGVMDVGAGYTIGIESDSYSWVSGDLRTFRSSGSMYMNEQLVATQSWVSSQGYVTGGPFLPLSGGTVTGTTNFNSTVNVNGSFNLFGGYGPGSGPGLAFENQGSFIRLAFWGMDFYDWNNGIQMTLDNGYVSVNNYLQAGNSLRAPIFYDSNDTSYYLDPNSFSNLNSILTAETKARKSQSDNNYTTAALWTESFNNTTTGIAFHISGVVGKFLEMRTNGVLYWENSQVVTNNGGTWGINITGSAGSASSATYLNGSNYIVQRGNQGSWNADFQATPAGTMSYGGDLGASTTNGPGGTWWMQQNFRHTNAGNYWGVQVAWGWEDNRARLATRNVQGGNYDSWVYYLNSSNYTDYTVTKTGGGASGTWGINITGNASYASTAGSASSASTAQGLASSGYGSGTQTWYQTSGTFAGYSGWASYLVSNHGDGATYYNQTIIMPFWGAPQYSRLEGGTFRGPYIFVTTENSPYAYNMNQYVRTTDSPTFFGTLSISADNSVNYTGSRIWLYSHSSYRGSGVYMSLNGGNSTWYAGSPYTDFSGYYMIGYAAATGTDAAADPGNRKWQVSPSGNTYQTGSATATGFFEISDARLKTIVDEDYRVDSIVAIKPKFYQKNGKFEVGYIAQEVEGVYAHAVTLGSDGYLGLSYSQVHTLKIAALEDSVDDIKKKIKELEEKINTLY